MTRRQQQQQQQRVESSRTIPPFAHAVGGCVGSALSLFLLYPLERARIEMQSKAGHRQQDDDGNDKKRVNDNKKEGDMGINAASSSSSSSSEDESWCTAGDPDQEEEQVADEAPALSALERQQRQQQTLESLSTTSLSHCLYNLWKRRQLYQGVVPILTAVGLSNFVFFFVNEWVKLHLIRHRTNNSQQQQQQQQHSRYDSLLASCLAGIGNVLLTNPVWLISFRISAGRASSDKNNLWQELLWVARNEGLWHLWTGVGSSLLLVSNPVIQFVLYEQLKEWQLVAKISGSTGGGGGGGGENLLQTTSSMNLSPIRAFCTGALAKAVSTTITYPLQLTQTVMRLQRKQDTVLAEGSSSSRSNTDPETSSSQLNDNTRTIIQPQPHAHYRNILDCLRQLYQQKGLSGLYTGMRAKLLQTVLTAAFTFLTYEQILRAVLLAHRNLLVASRRQQQQQTKKLMYK